MPLYKTNPNNHSQTVISFINCSLNLSILHKWQVTAAVPDHSPQSQMRNKSSVIKWLAQGYSHNWSVAKLKLQRKRGKGRSRRWCLRKSYVTFFPSSQLPPLSPSLTPFSSLTIPNNKNEKIKIKLGQHKCSKENFQFFTHFSLYKTEIGSGRSLEECV